MADKKVNFNISCIGSREISDRTFEILFQIGAEIAKRGWRVVSGNALGSDFAYASGANSIDGNLVTLYQPWPSYNSEQLAWGNMVILNEESHWSELAKKHHPRYDNLTQGAKKMMNRNVGIILGGDATLAVLNPNKIGGGGTGHGWRVSAALDRPRADLTLIENGVPTVDEVIKFLEYNYKKKLELAQ